jgi:LysR family transcriptional regulator, nitrogen assimilation regulatory protein
MIDTLLRIRLFVAAYEERSFTAAAVREHLTQSGMTQHMQRLEQHLGVKLFVRQSGNTMGPTPAADAYYAACVPVLRAHSQTRFAVQPFTRGLSGEVRIGLTPTLTRKMLAPTLSAFVVQHPNVVVRIVDSYSDLVINKLRAGEIDLAVVPGNRPEGGLRRRPFARMPEFLVSGARAGHPVVNGRPVSLAALGPIKLIVPSKAQARRAGLDAYLAQAGAIIDRLLEMDTALGATDFIQHSDWFAIHPAAVAISELQSGDFIVNPLVDPPLSLELFVLERNSEVPPPEAIAFVDELRRQTLGALDAIDALLSGIGESGEGQTPRQVTGGQSRSATTGDPET